MANELVTAKDLQTWYGVACDKVHFATDHDVIKTLIERIDRADTDLATAKQGWVSCIADLRKAADICRETETELVALRAKVARLEAPVSDDEWELLKIGAECQSDDPNGDPLQMEVAERGGFDSIIAARAKEQP